MPFQRQTAKKVTIADLMNGKWVKKEGMEPSYVVTPRGDAVSRARVLATVVSKFLAEDGNFGSLTLDDGSDTLRIKTFKTVKPVEGFEPGMLVEVIGKVREYNEEIYIIPEIVNELADPNYELLRKLELAAQKTQPAPAETQTPQKQDGKEALRKEILKVIGAVPDGISFTELMEKIKADENSIEAVVDDILAEGICYEPTPGKIKKI